MSRPDYDAIADFYDVDMARNMPFDDIGFYADICRRHGGRVLELGCGNGRILRPLLQQGVDVVGVDGSEKMLRQVPTGAAARIARMDVRALAFAARSFAVVLCPYSLITYMAPPEDAARLLQEVHRVLVVGGQVVVDAFIPKASVAAAEFRLDYVRPWGDGTLERTKRITPAGAHTNRIERRYRVLSGDRTVVQEVATCEEIRVFAPDELVALVQQCGFAVDERWWNYTLREPIEEAQFFTAVARAG